MEPIHPEIIHVTPLHGQPVTLRHGQSASCASPLSVPEFPRRRLNVCRPDLSQIAEASRQGPWPAAWATGLEETICAAPLNRSLTAPVVSGAA
jgi:hypothetical protein